MAIDWKHLNEYKTSYLIDLVSNFYQSIPYKTIKNLSRSQLLKMLRAKH